MSRPGFAAALLSLSVFSLGWLLVNSSTTQSQETSASESSTRDSLVAKRARLFLQLQRAKLEQAEALNRRVPNSVSESDLNNLQLSIEIGENLFEAVQDDVTDARKSAYLAIAKKVMVSAENELLDAEKVRELVPGRFSDEDMEVLKLKVSVAKVNFEIGEKALDSSIEDQLHWKIDLLYDEVLKLRNELKQVRGRR